jgi:hypothetical protein
VGADRELTDQPGVGVGVAEHPAGAVDVEDRWQLSGEVLGSDDPNGDVTDGATRHLQVLDLDGGLLDLAGLDLVDGLAPSTGPRSNRYGGLAVASANSCAAGSRIGLVVMVDMCFSLGIGLD